MGSLRQRGAVVHSYLEDGFGALFNDCSTIAGWAFLEHYIIEHLLGGKLAHCIGGLTTDPVKRAGWIFALKEIHGSDCLGSMVYGDTISFGDNFAYNRGVVSEYLLWDIMAQLECPTGHAVLISTHNGMALEYAARLKKVITTMDQSIPIIMGGVLNQKYEDKALPIDVSKELTQLGLTPCAQLGR